MPPILQKRTTKHFVNFTPKVEDFDEDAFPKWREEVGNKYLALNPLTKEGQQQVAKFNNLCLDDDFWNRPVHDTYWDLLVEVHKKGPLDGWNAGTREGLHRRTGIFIRLLCAKFDSEVFRANTLTENDFIQMGIEKKLTDPTKISGKPFATRHFTEKRQLNPYCSRTVRSFTSRNQISMHLKQLGIIEPSVKI